MLLYKMLRCPAGGCGCMEGPGELLLPVKAGRLHVRHV